MTDTEEQFTSAAAWWWTCLTQPNIDVDQERAAREKVRDLIVTVPPDNTVREAVTAWFNFESDRVVYGSRPSDWRRRDELHDRMVVALNGALDEVAGGAA